jgi:hypothetical protein
MGRFRSKRTPPGQRNGTLVSRCLLGPVSVQKLTLCETPAKPLYLGTNGEPLLEWEGGV